MILIEAKLKLKKLYQRKKKIMKKKLKKKLMTK